jgi:hypothetical protein
MIRSHQNVNFVTSGFDDRRAEVSAATAESQVLKQALIPRGWCWSSGKPLRGEIGLKMSRERWWSGL